MTFDFATFLDILKVAVGLTYLYLEYKALRAMWIASVIMPCIGMVLFYDKGLYADAAINVYYLAIAVYGWYEWSRRGAKTTHAKASTSQEDCDVSGSNDGDCGSVTGIAHTPLKVVLPLVAVWLSIWGLIAWVLATFTNSTVVALDSLTTSMSIVAMWMLARKYMEQWLVWFVVDMIYAYLYWVKGIYFSGSLYLFYTVMALAGYRKWRRLATDNT